MDTTQATTLLRQRLAIVEEQIQTACVRAQRSRDSVTLIAVSKTVSAAWAGLLHEVGVSEFGENRPQELWHKAAALPNSVHWHLIGHLQRNKIERTLPLVQWIHSVDSVRLLEALEQEATKQQRTLSVLLEVNASGEATKHGFAPAALESVVPVLARLRHVQVRGLMTMAAPTENPEEGRPTFALLRQLRDRLQTQIAALHHLTELSMGMSQDFPQAIAEGATMIRLGTILWADIVEAAT